MFSEEDVKKKISPAVWSAISLLLIITSCSNAAPLENGFKMIKTEETFDSADAAGQYVNVETTEVNFTMVYLPADVTFPTGYTDTTIVSLDKPCFVGETEVTYELWYTVCTWATAGTGGSTGEGEYSFANTGREGSLGIDNAVPSADCDEPATNISYRDAIVWCNALTEWYNAATGSTDECVYRYGGNVLRDSNSETCDDAEAASAATGFRLLSVSEWEFAARYINDADGDSTICESGEYYPNDYSSGADAPYSVTSGAVDYDGDGDTEYTNDVTIGYNNSNNETCQVGSRSANALGLYDMNGNVSEFCFGAYGYIDGELKMNMRGGSYMNQPLYLRVSNVSHTAPDNAFYSFGIRLGKNQ